MEFGFKEKDKQQVIEFLNFVAKKATFNDLKIEDNIKLFKLLSFMQVELLGKLDANLVDDLKIKQIATEHVPEPAPKKKAK